MRKLAEIVKSDLENAKDSIQFVAGFLTLILSTISLLAKIFESRYAVSLFLIGLFLIVRRVCTWIIRSKRQSFGVSVQSFSGISITFAKGIRHLSWALWIYPLFIAVFSFFPKNTSCDSQQPHFGILITSFTNSTGDDFSYKLFNHLEAELYNNDTIKTIKVDNFLNIGRGNLKDSVQGYYSSNCLNHGLLVFGKRNEQSRMFDCNIYVHKLPNLILDSSRGNNNILFLRNPDLVNFSIDNQANIVAEFILGLLYYNANKFQASQEKFSKSIELSSSSLDAKFKSYCHFYIGNNLFKEGKMPQAIECYKQGLLYDSSNAFLHFNLAAAFLKTLDTINARREFQYASSINVQFSNPLGQFDNVRHERRIAHFEKEAIEKVLTEKGEMGDSIEHAGNKPKPMSGDTVFFVSQVGEKYGVVNDKGQNIIPYEFDFIDNNIFSYQGYRFFVVQKAGKFGAISIKRVLEVPLVHPSVTHVHKILKTSIDFDPSSVDHN